MLALHEGADVSNVHHGDVVMTSHFHRPSSLVAGSPAQKLVEQVAVDRSVVIVNGTYVVMIAGGFYIGAPDRQRWSDGSHYVFVDTLHRAYRTCWRSRWGCPDACSGCEALSVLADALAAVPIMTIMGR